MRPIYLDYNATTPLAPAVQEAMLPFLADQYGNPTSDHALGRAAAQAIDDARFRVATAIGAAPEEVFFCSGATESCHAALALRRRSVVTTAVDHRAVRDAPCDGPIIVSVPASGVVEPRALTDAAVDGESLVSLVHANNEVGQLQPVGEAARLLAGRGVLLHTDATQSFGKVRVDVRELGVDLLSLASHKCYGPKGAGALYVRGASGVAPPHARGAMLRSGTPDVAAIVGFGVAAELASRSVAESVVRLSSLVERLEALLREGVGDQLLVWGDRVARLPNTLAVAFPRVAGDELLAACPEVCATPLASRSGGSVQLSPTLRAMGAPPEIAVGSVRLSVGWHTDESEVDRAASLLVDAWERLAE